MPLNVQQQNKPTQFGGTKKLLRRRICKHTAEPAPFIRFGPLYSPEMDDFRAAKEKLWQHILRTPSGNEEKNKALYISSIRSIEKEARNSYDSTDRSFAEMTGHEFRMIMIQDSCFFIQLSLFFLGIHNHLPDHEFFREISHNRVKKRKCIASMFHVGNQIPLLVLKQIINQDYFQKIIANGSYEKPESDLAKMVFYEFVLLLGLKTGMRIPIWAWELQYQPCDILHGLHLRLLGPENNIKDESEDDSDDELDLEAGNSGTDSLLVLTNTSNNQTCGCTTEQKREFKSASELNQAGIKFEVVERRGIKVIRFKRWFYPFDPCLSLPPFLVDAHTKLLFQSLRNYEAAQKFDENQRELTSYLRFMHELIQTSEDARVLHLDGIIQGSWKHTEKVPRILKEVAGEEEITCPKLRLAKFQVNYFDRPPWVNTISQYFTLIFALTFLQTFYTMYAYHKPNS
ncbi:uncharacterized protein LOC107816567 [Nicotiana tabacum]|uniref:Uncharacterized protein LOC107816567 n=1 Tax=Nicotiana tabacum TaxID=4097 RepID=A0A1S4C9G6_TOBAC|nr:uncharacterized protein LOC104092639 [Nicotiana tomentosiformis]XP_016497778.1 PREDICTED: uncharacterized protein LOC107816567 [Nicotiana tabacum]